MSQRCRVTHCRFQNTHTTRGHICGTCKIHGHGQVECGNNTKIEYLKQFFDETMRRDEICKIMGCNDKYSHKSSAHQCGKCNRRGHDLDSCIIQPLDKAIQYYREIDRHNYIHLFNTLITRDKHNIETQFNGIYIIFPMGQGCQMYIKCDLEMQTITTLFMHGDSWGQYGEQTSDVPILDAFIENYSNYTNTFNNLLEINQIANNNIVQYNDNCGGDSEAGAGAGVSGDGVGGAGAGAGAGATILIFIKCPLCRKEHLNTSIIEIKGSCDTCSICYENKVEKCFIKCGHACICGDCFTKL